jgi:hypothetical protein
MWQINRQGTRDSCGGFLVLKPYQWDPPASRWTKLSNIGANMCGVGLERKPSTHKGGFRAAGRGDWGLGGMAMR